MSLRVSVFLLLIGFCCKAIALKCFDCIDIVNEHDDKNDCFFPNNDTTRIKDCPGRCYLFQYGLGEKQSGSLIEFIHTVRSCEPHIWDQCNPGEVHRSYHCVVCETDLCNTGFLPKIPVLYGLLLAVFALFLR